MSGYTDHKESSRLRFKFSRLCDLCVLCGQIRKKDKEKATTKSAKITKNGQ